MCEDCGLDRHSLDQLRHEEEEWWRADVGDAAALREWFPQPLDAEAAFDGGSRPVWVSTGVEWQMSGDLPAPEPRLVRDAVAQLGRVCFDRDQPVPVMTRWDARLTPLLLESAARFGVGEQPLVSVFMTRDEIAQAPTLAVCDWKLGQIVGGQPIHAALQRRHMVRAGYRAAVFIGGGSEVLADANAMIHQPNAKLFAIGSTGGAAAHLLATWPHRFGDNEPNLKLSEPASYLLLMHRVLKSV